MQQADSLRIRAPIVEIEVEEHGKISNTVVNTTSERIPTYILIFSMTNFSIFIYNGENIYLYFFILTAIIWTLSLLDVIYDTNTQQEVESQV
jgi:hypothetical protein|uniref:Uncharacterized protein n=1 Tax=viral metagenome TaxID=1070528 RepID=A0A6C0K8B4_9ZZZZ